MTISPAPVRVRHAFYSSAETSDMILVDPSTSFHIRPHPSGSVHITHTQERTMSNHHKQGGGGRRGEGETGRERDGAGEVELVVEG